MGIGINILSAKFHDMNELYGTICWAGITAAYGLAMAALGGESIQVGTALLITFFTTPTTDY